MIDVKVKENDQNDTSSGMSYTANIKCPLCKTVIIAYYLAKTDKRRPSVSPTNRWYYPNFDRHMMEKHNNLFEEGESKGEYSGKSNKKSLSSDLSDNSSKNIQPKIKDVFTCNKKVSVSPELAPEPEIIIQSDSDSDTPLVKKRGKKVTRLPSPVNESNTDSDSDTDKNVDKNNSKIVQEKC